MMLAATFAARRTAVKHLLPPVTLAVTLATRREYSRDSSTSPPKSTPWEHFRPQQIIQLTSTGGTSAETPADGGLRPSVSSSWSSRASVLHHRFHPSLAGVEKPRSVVNGDGYSFDPDTAGFIQEAYQVDHPFAGDSGLRNIIRRHTPEKHMAEFYENLCHLGTKAIGPLARLGASAEANEPYVMSHDARGRRVDRLVTSSAWRELRRQSSLEGIVSVAYGADRERLGAAARVLQMARLFLFSPDTAIYACPLAMTDGAARAIELFGDDDMKKHIFPRLTSRDPDVFWTSGQWMTERPGGSDVGNTETEAMLDTEPTSQLHEALPWSLHGLKWFSSATDSDVAMVLARARDPETGDVVRGSRGLSLFLTPVRLPSETPASEEVRAMCPTSAKPAATSPGQSPWDSPGPCLSSVDSCAIEGTSGLEGDLAAVTIDHEDDLPLNGIRILRLKDKLGTRALPTAELRLSGTRARMIGAPGRGVASISPVLTITRLYTAMQCAASSRRAHLRAIGFSKVRKAFGVPIARLPAHARALARNEVTTRAASAFVFEVAALLGRTEQIPMRDGRPAVSLSPDQRVDEAVLRLLTPVVKMYAARLGTQACQASVEAFGGAGYIETNGMARYLRDTQVGTIWEGTADVLSADVVRVLRRGGVPVLMMTALEQYVERLTERALNHCTPETDTLAVAAQLCRQSASRLRDLSSHAMSPTFEARAQAFAMAIGRLVSSACLVDVAAASVGGQWSGRERDVEAALRWTGHTVEDILGQELLDSERLGSLHPMTEETASQPEEWELQRMNADSVLVFGQPMHG
ncbi:hypothetical protein H696_01766 [Fonticula alba]|uniref:Acyl-CoA dehydrogenase/oxidase C-terminal domain-containing protein n=1 Tax=Fonticula alba TaxID=691883 RepID=A0A058ZFX4_FONAL|nr:hypothetical protein H696_01766 [Fonticula alba]KCV72372.1 hypothetical protein H696_01766 [Fonticula alba]|eukprot:XP_009493950.1 hypothetical protein H696_01766 [Fonticula alba]